MPRSARIVLPGYPHHVTHRGNYGQIVFEGNEDYVFYLKLISKYGEKYGLVFLSYVLMPNHVHFIVIPQAKDSLSKTFNVTQMTYAQYINEKRGNKGHLWGGRFYSCVLDPTHLYRAVRYVERNPVRARLVQRAWDWPWSSAKERLGSERGIISLGKLSEFVEINDWEKFLSEAEEDHYIDELRKCTRIGRPIGDSKFIKQLEDILQKPILPGKRGRPRKNR